MIAQTLRGLVGQSMSGSRNNSGGYARTFTAKASAYSWTVPVGGLYEFGAWGCGTVSNSGFTGTGAFALKRIFLGAGQIVTIQVGLNTEIVAPGGGVGGSSTDTVVTLPNGTSFTAGSAIAATSAGAASGGDVNINGTAGTTSAISGPSYTSEYRVYTGGEASGQRGPTPAGATGNGGGSSTYGSDGLVVVSRVA